MRPQSHAKTSSDAVSLVWYTHLPLVANFRFEVCSYITSPASELVQSLAHVRWIVVRVLSLWPLYS